MKKLVIIGTTVVLTVLTFIGLYFLVILTPTERAMFRYRDECSEESVSISAERDGNDLHFKIESDESFTFPFGSFCIPFENEFNMPMEALVNGNDFNTINGVKYFSKWHELEVTTDHSFVEDIRTYIQIYNEGEVYNIRLNIVLDIKEGSTIYSSSVDHHIDISNIKVATDYADEMFGQ